MSEIVKVMKSATKPAVATTGKPLLLGAGLFAVFLALLFFSSSRSPSLEHSASSSEKAGIPVRSEPAVPTKSFGKASESVAGFKAAR